MTALPPWPALDADRPWLGETIAYQRGIWGKAHGQPFDYRWIARSPGLGAGLPDIARALLLGAESRAVRGHLWRSLADRRLAVHVYPSRARDAAGRPTLLEKQVIEWRASGDLPACAAALVLLPLVATRGDADWWDDQWTAPWDRRDYALPIAAAQCPPVRLDGATLGPAIDAGLAELVDTVPRAALRAFYAELLGGRHPAPLVSERPLTPLAVAALLLPAPRSWAERLSIAGALSASALVAEQLRGTWDAVVVPPEALRAARPPEVDEALALAGTVVEAIEHADPSPLRTWYHRRDGRVRVAARAGCGHPAPRPPVRGPWLADPVMGLPALPPGSAPIMFTLHRFADRIDARMLDLGALDTDLAGGGRPLPSIVVRQLTAWIEALCGDRPGWVDERQWQLKIDLLRAAVWCLAPAPERVVAPGLPRGSDVPTLLLAPLVESRLGPAWLAPLGADAYRAALLHSLACTDQSFSQALRRWARYWVCLRGAPEWAAEATSVALASDAAGMTVMPQRNRRPGHS